MNTRTVYDLSFVSRAKSLSRVPEIVVTLPRDAYENLLEHFKGTVELHAEHIQGYLGLRKRPRYDLGEKGLLGYRSCCRIEQERGATHLYFELRARHRKELVVTLSIILATLQVVIKRIEGDDQYIEVDAHFGGGFHGHALGGVFYPPFVKWLATLNEGEKVHGVRDRVVTAMREAWYAVAPPGLKRYKDASSFHLAKDGRPSWACFGDACDVAVYPDMVREMYLDGPVPFDSHNLDNPIQQLTFLAGIAELWGLAREEHTHQ
jgi:hypothetical protein